MDLEKWSEFYKDYDSQVVVITRCQEICALARVRTFGGTVEKRNEQGLYGQELVSSWIKEGNERITLLSYETLCALKGEYLKRKAKEMRIDADPDHIDRLAEHLVSGNPKYLLEEPPSGQTIPPAPNPSPSTR